MVGGGPYDRRDVRVDPVRTTGPRSEAEVGIHPFRAALGLAFTLLGFAGHAAAEESAPAVPAVPAAPLPPAAPGPPADPLATPRRTPTPPTPPTPPTGVEAPPSGVAVPPTLVETRRVPVPVGDVAVTSTATPLACRGPGGAPRPWWTRFEVDVQGGFSWVSCPDARLGEPVAGNPAPLGFDDLEEGPAFSGRVTVAYRCSPAVRFEARVTAYGDPGGTADQAGFFGTRPDPGAPSELSRPVAGAFDEEATAWGAELVAWRALPTCGSWRFEVGAGARHFAFEEIAHLDLATTGAGAVPFADGFVDAYVENRWWGLEGCVSAYADVTPSLTLSATFKALAGWVERHVAVTDGNLFANGVHAASARSDGFAAGAEFEVGARLRLSSCVHVSAAVNVLFLDGVQRAHDAFDLEQGATGRAEARDDPDAVVIGSLFLGVTVSF